MEEKKTYQKEYEFGFNDGNEYLLNEKKGLKSFFNIINNKYSC